MNGFSLLACPLCHGELSSASDALACTNSTCKRKFKIIDGIPNFLLDQRSEDVDLSIDKWDRFYDKAAESEAETLYEIYLENNFDNVFRQLNEYRPLNTNTVFLEIGCGPMVLGRALADRCNLIVGIDFSLTALKIAKKMLDANGISNYLLVCGDIQQMPFKSGVIDVLYGGGVLEHIQNTQTIVDELYRVLAKDGVSFNTVPMLNIGSLTYRQLWGNIPNFPGLKQVAEFIHIKVLNSRHLTFGYELSFLRSHISSIHKKAGFKKVVVDKFETKLLFEFIPFAPLKKFFIDLANSSPLFWPMIKVIGIKS